MKIDRHGKAKILSQAEIQLLFSQGLHNDRDSPDWMETLESVQIWIRQRLQPHPTTGRQATTRDD